MRNIVAGETVTLVWYAPVAVRVPLYIGDLGGRSGGDHGVRVVREPVHPGHAASHSLRGAAAAGRGWRSPGGGTAASAPGSAWPSASAPLTAVPGLAGTSARGIRRPTSGAGTDGNGWKQMAYRVFCPAED